MKTLIIGDIHGYLDEVATAVLGHEAVTDSVKRKALRQFSDTFLANETALEAAFARGIVSTLLSEGLLEKDEEPEVLEGLGIAIGEEKPGATHE